jgi:hypothetical protein
VDVLPLQATFNFLHIGNNKKKNDEPTCEMGAVPGRKTFYSNKSREIFQFFSSPIQQNKKNKTDFLLNLLN